IAQVANAVTGNPQTLQPDDAVAILADLASANGVSGTIQAAALAEINTLATAYPASASAAIPGLLLLVESPNSTTVQAGYTALNGLIPANPTPTSQIVTDVVGLISQFPTFPSITGSAQAEILSLVSNGTISTNAAITAFTSLPASQQLQPLVALLGVGDEATVFTYLQQVTHSPSPAFTTDQIIAAIAQAYGSNTARMPTTVTELEVLVQAIQSAGGNGPSSLVTDIANVVSSAEQVSVLANLLVSYNAAAAQGSSFAATAAAAFSACINTLLLNQTPSQLAASLGALFNSGAFTGAQVMQTAVNDYLSTSTLSAFLNEIADLSPAFMSAAAVAHGVVDAVTSGGLSEFQGVEALLTISIGSAPALQSAAVSALATALANNAPIATGAMTNIGFMINEGVATAGQAVTFLTQIAIAQPTTSSTVIAEIATLVASNGVITALNAATAMALAAHGLSATQQAAVGVEIGALFAIFGLSESQQAGAIAAAAGAGLTADETIGVLAGFAAQGGAVLQVGIGVAIAGLVQAGTISANQAVTDLIQSFLVSSVTTAAQLNNVVVGLLSGGSTAAAVGLVEGLIAHGLLESVSDVAAVTNAAVAANTVTALKVVD